MHNIQLVKIFTRNDLRLIGRDSMLYGIFLFLLVIAFVFRFGLPWLNSYLASHNVLPNESITNYLSDYYPLVVSFFIIFNASAMVGFVFGFVLLDEKDDRTINAMLVTPVPFNLYILFRVCAPCLLAFCSVVLITQFIGQATISLWKLIFIAIGAALAAPITSLYLAIVAENKMQGFVYGKFISLAGWIIILAWFSPQSWQWLFGIFPPYWISKAYWLVLEGSEFWWATLSIGVIYQLFVIKILLRTFTFKST